MLLPLYTTVLDIYIYIGYITRDLRIKTEIQHVITMYWSLWVTKNFHIPNFHTIFSHNTLVDYDKIHFQSEHCFSALLCLKTCGLIGPESVTLLFTIMEFSNESFVITS